MMVGKERTSVWVFAMAGMMLVGAPILVGADNESEPLEMIKKAVSEKKAILVDVREKEEWNDGHLEDAKSLPLSLLRKGVNQEELSKQLPKDKVIYCHCAAGRRTPAAAKILKQHGYDVRPLKSGYDALVEFGFATAPK
ncbi:MAG: rhodanese-like domain-containing protein [Gemmataceae bacterium]